MERISVASWEEAQTYKDHTDRYELATKYIRPGSTILDAACGVGYGTAFLASHPNAGRVFGVDYSVETLAFAFRHHHRKNIEYLRKNLDDTRALFNLKFGLITCFQTLEHLVNDFVFLVNIRKILSPAGTFIISVAHERMFPYATTGSPYHYRHYYTHEILRHLKLAGFEITEFFSQVYENGSSEIRREQSALSNLFVCRLGASQ